MSAFKKLNRQDVYVSDYNAKRQWQAEGNLIETYHIQTLRGFSGSTPGYPYPLDYRNSRYEKLIYDSVNHNYYADALGNGIFSGSRDLSLQSTLTVSGSRDIRSEIGVISLPKHVYGTHIEPGTLVIKPKTEIEDRYVTEEFSVDYFSGDNNYMEDVEYWYGSNPIDTEDYIISESNFVEEVIEGEYVDIDFDQQRLEIVDDGNGNLIFSGSNQTYTKATRVIGDVIYNQGQIIFTDTDVARYYSTYSRHIVRWKSNQPIYTYTAHCRVKGNEMNFTQNPTAVTGSNGQLRSNVTGSDFQPYVTTIGLYNDANELIAVAKTNRPIPKPDNVDLTFEVKIDM
jgi:hypothetical protein